MFQRLSLVRRLARRAVSPFSGAPFTRADLISLISLNESALEIGPFTNPMLVGPNVSYFDVLDKAHLIERARSVGYPVVSPVEIDFVSPIGDLSAVTGTFDVIASSHCIEHQPDLVSHLQKVEQLLNPGGRYLLTIPDKRYCFDHFLQESSASQALAAFHERRKVHTLENVIEHRAMTTHNDALRHWRGDHGEQRIDPHNLAIALSEFDASNGEYIDVHAWQFTPGSFGKLISDLNGLGVCGLRVEAVHETPFGSLEFCAALTKFS